MPFLSFYHYSWYKNIHRNSLNSLLNVIHSIWLTITWFWLNSNCLSCARFVVSSLSSSKQHVSSMSVHSLRLTVSLPYETSEMGDTHVYLLRPVAPTPRTQPCKLQNVHRNLEAGLPKKNSQRERNDVMVWLACMALSNASPITLQTCDVM